MVTEFLKQSRGFRPNFFRWCSHNAVLGLCSFILTIAFTWSADAFSTEAQGSNGILVGSGRLHPYIDTTAHYLYNPHRLQSDGNSQTLLRQTQGPQLSVKPGFTYSQPSPKLQLQLSGFGQLRYYLSSSLQELPLLTGQLKLNVLFNPQSTVPITIDTSFRRSDRPATQAVNYSLVSNTTSVEAGTRWTPGGGALSVELKVPLVYTAWDADGAQFAYLLSPSYQGLDNLTLKPGLRVAWKFFPKTAFVFDSFARFTRYVDKETISENLDFIGATIGVRGAITPKISTILALGWAQPILASDYSSEAQNVIGKIQLGYKLNRSFEFRIQAGKEVKATPLFNYHEALYSSAGVLIRLGTKLAIHLDLETRYLQFAKPSNADAAAFTQRNDLLLKPQAVISYHLADWISLSINNQFEARDTGVYTNPYRPTETTNTSYNYYNGFLRLNARY